MEKTEEFQDPLYESAVRHVQEENTATISFLQRRLIIGFNRANRLLERMENEGVVGPLHSNGGREIL